MRKIHFTEYLQQAKEIIKWMKNSFIRKYKFGEFGSNSIIEYPCRVESPSDVYINDNVHIRFGICIINAIGESVIIKKNTVLAPNVTLVTNNHTPTVGIPIYLLVSSHINDKSSSIVIDEDVWIGTRVTILQGVRIGRGAIVGANSLITKSVPPYSVVAGNPAKVIATRFNLKQVISHEKKLYEKADRLQRTSIEDMFSTTFKDLHSLGLDEISEQSLFDKLNEIKKEKKFIE